MQLTLGQSKLGLAGTITFAEKFHLHYLIFGDHKAKNTVLCFHGFGQDADVFEPLVNKFKDARIISLDLPFHGKTIVPNERVDKSLWKQLAAAIFQHFDLQQFTIVSYSLGGRFAIRTIMDYPEKIEKAYFIAADGFHSPPIYKIATSWPGKQLFKSIIDKPDWMLFTVKQFSRYGITNKSLLKFTQNNLEERQQRERAFLSWNLLKPLRTSPIELANQLKSNAISTHVFIGKKDYVIKENFFDDFLRFYPAANKVLLNKRHHEMIDAFVNHEK